MREQCRLLPLSWSRRRSRETGALPPAPAPSTISLDMRQYLDVLRKAMTEGDDRQDRTGVGTRAIFGEVMRFRMSDGFPAMTTKRLAFRSVVAELLWFLNGSSDIRELHALGVHIWDGNAYAPYWRERARLQGGARPHHGQQMGGRGAPPRRRLHPPPHPPPPPPPGAAGRPGGGPGAE